MWKRGGIQVYGRTRVYLMQEADGITANRQMKENYSKGKERQRTVLNESERRLTYC